MRNLILLTSTIIVSLSVSSNPVLAQKHRQCYNQGGYQVCSPVQKPTVVDTTTVKTQPKPAQAQTQPQTNLFEERLAAQEAALKELSEKVAGVSQLQQQVTALQATITELKNTPAPTVDLSGINTQITELQQLMLDFAKSHKAQMDTVNSSIAALTNQQSGTAQRLAALHLQVNPPQPAAPQYVPWASVVQQFASHNVNIQAAFIKSSGVYKTMGIDLKTPNLTQAQLDAVLSNLTPGAEIVVVDDSVSAADHAKLVTMTSYPGTFAGLSSVQNGTRFVILSDKPSIREALVARAAGITVPNRVVTAEGITLESYRGTLLATRGS